MSSAKVRPFCPDLNVFSYDHNVTDTRNKDDK